MEKLKEAQMVIAEKVLRMKVATLIGSPDGPCYGAMFFLGLKIALAMEGRSMEKPFTQKQVNIILDGLLLACLSVYKTIGDESAAEMYKKGPEEAMQ